MDTKLIKTIEQSITSICVIASIVGMCCIGIATWHYLSENYQQAIELLVKLF